MDDVTAAPTPSPVPETETEPAPWAMQLAARVEKVDPPTTADLCAAAALAAIGVVGHEHAQADGPWAAPVHAWQGGGRIRKLVRRARGAAWERAQRPSGITAVVGRAEVRAYVPSQMDAVPDEVATLQIRSSDLDEPARITELPQVTEGPTMVIAITPAVPMSWGKQAAQSAHAGQILWRESTPEHRDAWQAAGQPISVVHPTDTLWPAILELAPAHVHDGGFTEVAPGTLTAAAMWGDGRA